MNTRMKGNRYFDKEKAGFATADPMLYGLLKEHAKRMRQMPTETESLLWRYLSQNYLGVPFRRQHIILDNIVDFVSLSAKLVIEVDGGYHDDLRQKYHDDLRTEELNRMGFRVIRFTNDEVYNEIEKVIGKIKNELQNEKNKNR